jgi:hypothetical protein
VSFGILYSFTLFVDSVCHVALHDAFNLYGRPEAWTWDPLDPISLMFGYPVGPKRDVCCELLYHNFSSTKLFFARIFSLSEN